MANHIFNRTGYQIRILEKRKEDQTSEFSLQMFCHNQVLRICCKIAQNGGCKSLNQWRPFLQQLPGKKIEFASQIL